MKREGSKFGDESVSTGCDRDEEEDGWAGSGDGYKTRRTAEREEGETKCERITKIK